jgi:methylated-DNA-[protein]-cysteine S-methyltransferase
MNATQVNETPEWDDVRDRLVARAERESLIDVACERHDSPFGTLLLAAGDGGLVRIGLAAESEDAVIADLAARISPRILRSSRPAITAARRQLDEYFGRRRRRFDLDLDRRLSTGFRLEVLEAAERVPYGETATYGSLAAAAGRPAASRAAGTALATNPLPIVVPCHRILRSGGAIGEYLGGPEMKRALLELEGAL